MMRASGKQKVFLLFVLLWLLVFPPGFNTSLALAGPINSGGGDPDASAFIAIGRRIHEWLPKSDFRKFIDPDRFQGELDDLAASLDGSFPKIQFPDKVRCDLGNENLVYKMGCVLPSGVVEIDRELWTEDSQNIAEKRCELVTLEILRKMGVTTGRYELAHRFIEAEAKGIGCDLSQPNYPLPEDRLVKDSVFAVSYACYDGAHRENFQIVAELSLNQNPDYLRVYKNNGRPDIYMRPIDRRPISRDRSADIPKSFLKKTALAGIELGGIVVGFVGALPLSVILGSEALVELLFFPTSYAGYIAGEQFGRKILYQSNGQPDLATERLSPSACLLIESQNLSKIGFLKQ